MDGLIDNEIITGRTTMKLAEWMALNADGGGEKMRWKGYAQPQFEALQALEKAFPDAEISVIGYHISKSIQLPVARIHFPGLRVFARNNFSNWAITVQSERPVQGLDTEGMRFKDVSSAYFEGFERSGAPVYTSTYRQNQRRFSFFASADPAELQRVVQRLVTALS